MSYLKEINKHPLNNLHMLDQLVKLVQQNAGDAIAKNPAIPDQQNNAAISDVAQNIFSGLQTQAAQGNLPEILSMFKNGGGSSMTSNPVVANLINNVATSLASKFGISSQTAQQIATSLLPTIMNQFVKKTNDPQDNDFNLQDVLGKFTGNSNVGDLLNQFGGGKGDGAGGSGAGGMLGKIFGG
jgi:hypothetical protein